MAAHTEKSDLIRVSLAVKDEPKRVLIQLLSTHAIPTNEIQDFLKAVSHTEHHIEVAINKQLDYLGTKIGKPITNQQ